tara:strand:+ start:13818 stop:14282 length:465 start_codon:yes stop_codon:yes gene_type:complete
MATSLSNATLTVTLEEDITLNGSRQGSKNVLRISDINEVYKRIVNVTTSEIALYTTDDSVVGGSQFDDDNVKYARITNLDNANYIVVRVKNADNDEFAYKLNAGESFLLYQHEGTMNAGTATTLDIGTGWHDITSVKLTAPTDVCDAEIFVASS